MSSFFHHSSIRTKFSLVIISGCFAVLILVSLFFASIEYTSFREKTAEELQTQAAILASQLAQPLLERRPFKAKQILAALKTNSHLHAAYLFNDKNRPFAQYLDPGSSLFVQRIIDHDFSGSFPEQWRSENDYTFRFGFDNISLYTPIFYQKQNIGGLYLLSDLKDLDQRLFGILVVVLLAGGISVVFAWIFSGWLHRPISEPILQLSNVMRKVSDTGDYHFRTQKSSDDEIGQLADGFNEMLSQIEIRDLEIESHQKHLEQTVQERTAELITTVNELDIARREAESASLAKSAFLANMTHELRTPLVGVLGMNELMIESNLSTQQRSLADSVQRSGGELLSIINDILDFSKLEGGHLKLEITQVDLLELIEESISILAERAYRKGIELICHVEPSAAWIVEADPLRLKQILLNLLGNAIKFTDEGYVGLSLKSPQRGRFIFEVHDTGIGIDKNSQDEIFESFSQVDDSTSRLFGGTGLGLSIVRDLTDMMGGSVSLDSIPLQGSTFQVELSFKPIRHSFVRLPLDRLGIRVLLCMPHQKAREALLKRLGDLGFAAEAVASVDEFGCRLTESPEDGCRYDLVMISEGDQFENYRRIIARLSDFKGKIIVLKKKVTDSEVPPGTIELLEPILWSHLLQDDFVAESPLVSHSTAHIAPQVASVSNQRNRILIVDDNLSTRELIRFSLVGSDWQCEEAGNAEETYAAIEGGQFQLVLMDINMPGEDGIEVTRKLREQGVDTPIIALTAHSEGPILENCLQMGMQGHLKKPFRQRELFSLLEKYSLNCNGLKAHSDSDCEDGA